MAITPDEVKRIAHLARLGVDDGRLAGYAKELSSVLGLVEQMDQADADGVEPMAHPAHATQRLREDSVTESDQREELQSCAPLVEKGLFLVPKVIE